MKKYEILSWVFIFIISAISVFDLFINSGRPVTFDGPTHMTDIAGYSLALKDGNFPVYWLGTFGNYGMPVGFYSHQLILTIAGGVNIFLHNPVFTYNLFFFLGILLTNSVFYLFLRRYFSIQASLAGITLLTFSAYRITDIYIRGDLPETFSGIFLGIILLSTYYLVKRRNILGFFGLALSYFCLAITHPMMLVSYSFLIFPYLLYILFESGGNTALASMRHVRQWVNGKYLAAFCMAMILGVSMAAYFVLPLAIETKYLYFGQEKNHLSAQYLSWLNFFGEQWYYFYKTDIFPRGQFIELGSIEIMIAIAGLVFLIWSFIQKGWRKVLTLLDVAVMCACIVLFMTTIFSSAFYNHISILSNLQFPWRLLSVFIFLPPLILSFFIDKVKKQWIALACIIFILVLRFPQLYGKNYTQYPLQSYYFTPYNLFPISMNPVWTGKAEDYPIERDRIGIISGKGTILSENLHNTSRIYTVSAQTPLRLVDYTFYFPGWNVYVDGVTTPIEFQDPAYRGVITYNVPMGMHTIRVVLQDTSIRRLGKILSLFFIGIFIILLLTTKKIAKFVFGKKLSE